MKYCKKCLVKNGNFDFFAMMLQTSCGAIRQRKRVTLQTSCGTERVKWIGPYQVVKVPNPYQVVYAMGTACVNHTHPSHKASIAGPPFTEIAQQG